MRKRADKEYNAEIKALVLSPLKLIYRSVYYLFKSFKLYLYKQKRKIQLKNLPEVIQLPITNKCNLNCKMCNVPSCGKEDISLAELDGALKDPLFDRVIAVGVNGGEPFIKSNFEEYIETVSNLPEIKNISIISNGILTKRILEKMERVYEACKSKKIRLAITFSIDGCEAVHDDIRGVKGAFQKTISTIAHIKDNKDKYCDSISIICTISKYNIFSITDLSVYAELNNLPTINYQLAVNHKRLDTSEFYDDFSVLSDEYTTLLATEFFYGLYLKTKRKNYYAIYYFLLNNGQGRLVDCQWQDRDVTLDASGDLFYCAVYSDKIGSIFDGVTLKSEFFDKKNLKYRKSILKNHCNECIHYNSGDYTFSANIKYYKYIFDMSVWSYKYIFYGRKY